MATNVYGATGGRLNGVTALADGTFVAAGITTANTVIIYELDPIAGTTKSYVPGRTTNAITSFINGKSYLVQALADMDLTAYVGPPFPGEGELVTSFQGAI